MKTFSNNIAAKVILIVGDFFGIYLSLTMAYYLHGVLRPFLELKVLPEVTMYVNEPLFYIVPFVMFIYEGIYTKRYDFWHESREVIKSLLVSLVVVFFILAMLKLSQNFSRLVVAMAFLLMMFIIPLYKNIAKKALYKCGLWKRRARVYGCDVFVGKEIFSNHYLGYVLDENERAETVFVNSYGLDYSERNRLIQKGLKEKYEVVFIPMMEEFDLTQSHIYQLQNTRTNIIVFQNRLASQTRLFLQQFLNYFFVVLLLPILLPIIAVFAFLIKRESPGPIFFTHNRVGKNGRVIPTYKFRSMFSDAKERLETLLKDDAVRKEWERNFKLKEDPRITKIGKFLRKTSLDELPQIFNVLKGEMNFVGPRPVIQKEIDQYYKEDAEFYFMVKPGITGLWQVSGRSDTDYDFRVKIDKYYVVNWSLWLDIVILFKTIKVVLKRDGAY